ncbi:hypothetical protein IGI37_001018 [Enterococcus sp. AZ194]
MDLVISENLREIDFGKWEGKLIEPLKFDKEVINLRNYPDKYTPSKFNGEDYFSLIKRFENLLSELEINGNGNYLIVGHGVMLTTLLQTARGYGVSEVRKDGLFKNGSISIVEIDSKGNRSVILYDFPHYDSTKRSE